MYTICYLDFDGCLHDSKVYCTAGVGIHIRTPGRTLFEWMPILEELFAPYPDVRIVLSTSWVASQNFEFARDRLSPELRRRVIGSTYNEDNLRYFDAWPRGRQVYSDVQIRRPDYWFAIDDDVSGWPSVAEKHFIRTNGGEGISNTEVQARIRQALLSSSNKNV